MPVTVISKINSSTNTDGPGYTPDHWHDSNETTVVGYDEYSKFIDKYNSLVNSFNSRASDSDVTFEKLKKDLNEKINKKNLEEKLADGGRMEQAFQKISTEHLKRIDERSVGLSDSLRRSEAIHSSIQSTKESSDKLAKQVSAEATAVTSKLAEVTSILKQAQATLAEINQSKNAIAALAEQVAKDKQSVLTKAESLYSALAEVKTVADKATQAEAARNEQATKLQAKLEEQAQQAEAERSAQLNQLQAKLEEKSQQIDAVLAKLAQKQALHSSFFGRLKWLFLGA